jgi:hypothetical protein
MMTDTQRAAKRPEALTAEATPRGLPFVGTSAGGRGLPTVGTASVSRAANVPALEGCSVSMRTVIG